MQSKIDSVFYLKKFTHNRIISAVINPTNIYLFKVNNRNTRKRCEICSKLTGKTLGTE